MTPITHPVALSDQYQAAERELEDTMRHAAETEQMSVSVGDGSDWLNQRFTQHMANVTECPHLTLGPRPMFTALWTPSLVVCRQCLPQLDSQDERCDRCGTQVDEVVMTAVQTGPLLTLYALCDPCADADQAESTPAE